MFNNVVYTISAIDSILISGLYHKRFTIDSDDCDQEFIIEGVGSTKGLMYPTNNYCPVYQFNLLCFDQDTTHFITDYSIQNYNSSCSASNVGLEENPTNIIIIYPNPAAENISIDLPITHNKGSMQIYNLQGQLVKSETITGGGLQSFNISDIPNGVYNLVVYSATNKLIGREKLVVVR